MIAQNYYFEMLVAAATDMLHGQDGLNWPAVCMTYWPTVPSIHVHWISEVTENKSSTILMNNHRILSDNNCLVWLNIWIDLKMLVWSSFWSGLLDNHNILTCTLLF